jgi:phosphoribosylformylglycinamidine synthase
MLITRGAPALSDFRLQKLHNTLAPSVSGLRSISTEFVHFCALDAALTDDQQAV